jgi:hypothetical protein
MTCILCDEPRRVSSRGRAPQGQLCPACRTACRRYIDLPRSTVLRLRDAAAERVGGLLLARIDAALNPRFTAELVGSDDALPPTDA